MTAWSAWWCAARRLGFSDWRKADSEDLCRWLEASTPPLWRKNIAPLSAFFLLSTVLQTLGKAGLEQLFPDDVLLAAGGVNQLPG
jgi:hypothetical protein